MLSSWVSNAVAETTEFTNAARHHLDTPATGTGTVETAVVVDTAAPTERHIGLCGAIGSRSQGETYDGILVFMTDVTRILSAIEQGDPSAAEKLLPLVYDELRKLAAAKMTAEREDHTLQATALVHEAYLRLVDNEEAQHWDSRGHFFAAAAESMRRILVESARRKDRLKHGGGRQQISLDEVDLPVSRDNEDVLAIDEALIRLAELDETAARLVELRFFCGNDGG